MRKSAALLLPLLLVLVLGAAGCGKGGESTSSGNSATITMTSDNFAPDSKSVTINAGGQVTFNDPSATGGVHTLCFGANEACNGGVKNGPAEFSNPGNPYLFNPGDKKSFTFSTAGDYPITCTVHPNMDTVVHVK